MKKTTAITAVLFSVSVLSCTSLQENICQQNEKQNPKPQSYRIELEDAINSLNDFIAQATKNDDAISGKEIENILIIENPHVGSDSLTKAGAGVDENQYLLYVANFKDNQGYAVLSADTRLPVDIYAITEYGNVTEDDIYADDSVGFSPARMVYLAASGHIPAVDTTNKDIVIDNGGEIPDNDPMPDHPDGEWVITELGPWYDNISYPKMVLTQWGQNSPYNDLTGALYAGCTVVAVAQMMTYNCYPQSIDGVNIPFDVLRQMETVSSNSIYADSVAILYRDIYQDCGAKDYGENGSLLWPKDVVPYLEKLGYTNVELHKNSSSFELDIVSHSIMDGYPVIVSALNSDTGLWEAITGNANGHTWLIDGYIKQNRVGRKVGEETGKYYGNNFESREFVHCNWGWDGDHDGYFYPGIFSKNNPAPYNESQQQSQGGDNYNNFYRIITYSL